MAVLNGLHVVASYVDAAPAAAILHTPLWAETVASAGTSAAVPAGPRTSVPVLHLIASANGWVTIGPTPEDPAQAASKRFFIRSTDAPLDVYCAAGDKVRFTLDA